MRCIHTGQQNRSSQTITKQVKIGPYTYSQRKNKSQQSQHGSLYTNALKILHVHFESGKEHDIIKSHLAKQLKTAVTCQYIESMLTDNDSCQNHTDNVRNTQPFQNNGSEQYNNQHQEKNPRRVGDRKMKIKVYKIEHFFHK